MSFPYLLVLISETLSCSGAKCNAFFYSFTITVIDTSNCLVDTSSNAYKHQDEVSTAELSACSSWSSWSMIPINNTKFNTYKYILKRITRIHIYLKIQVRNQMHVFSIPCDFYFWSLLSWIWRSWVAVPVRWLSSPWSSWRWKNDCQHHSLLYTSCGWVPLKCFCRRISPRFDAVLFHLRQPHHDHKLHIQPLWKWLAIKYWRVNLNINKYNLI